MSKAESLKAVLEKEYGITTIAELELALSKQKLPIGLFVEKPAKKEVNVMKNHNERRVECV